MKSKKKKQKPKCPNCGKPFNGQECNKCGYDPGGFDPHWD